MTGDQDLPNLLKPFDKWRYIFAYRPMDIQIAKAEGIYIYDDRGNRYIDASGGPMAINLPHNHPRMKAAISAQLDRYTYTHPILADPIRAEFCKLLAEITPGNLNATYPVSGGSEAVETALKIARQAQINRGNKDKYKIISHRDSYHGMTLATLGVSHNPRSQSLFVPMLPQWPHIRQYSDFDRPAGTTREDWGVECAKALEISIHYEGPQTVAAFLATPHGCGADYAVVPPRSYWESIRQICDRYEVLLIADEVVTGLGRTGEWFGMKHFDVVPDIMTMAKGISSCYVPLGAVSVSEQINAPFLEGVEFVHGYCNAGHPLALAAGSEVIRIIREDKLLENCRIQSQRLFAFAENLLKHHTVKDVRGSGLMMVLELVKDKETMEFFDVSHHAETLLQSIALKNGLLLFGTLYGPRRQPAFRRGLPAWISPPLSITSDELDDLLERLDVSLTEWEETLGL